MRTLLRALAAIWLGAALWVLAAPAVPAQIRPLPHPDTTAGNQFGAAVALVEGRALVGAPGEDGCGPDSGAAYVFERGPDGWLHPAARLQPATCTPGRFFGRAVALSGERALVAAGGALRGVVAGLPPNTAHLFERDGDVWREMAVFAPEDEADGPFAAALALDGDRAVVTASGERGRRFGGRAYVYERRPDGRWVLVARLAPRRHEGAFGTAVALDGDRLAVVASPYDETGRGAVYVFERQPDGRWIEAAAVTGIEGTRVPVALAGDLMLVGHTHAGPNRSGAAVVYGRSRSSGRWVRLATLRAGVPYRDGAFGAAVALTNGPEGVRALATGYTEQLGREVGIDRVVYVFGYDPYRGWVRRQVLDLGAWAFGADVALVGRTALVGKASEAAPGAAFEVRLLH